MEMECWYVPFSMVLTKFAKNLLADGYEGGREAAHQLLTLSRTWLKLPQSTKLLVHVFANVNGLAIVLSQFGVISKPETLYEFVNGFKNEPLC